MNRFPKPLPIAILILIGLPSWGWTGPADDRLIEAAYRLASVSRHACECLSDGVFGWEDGLADELEDEFEDMADESQELVRDLRRGRDREDAIGEIRELRQIMNRIDARFARARVSPRAHPQVRAMSDALQALEACAFGDDPRAFYRGRNADPRYDRFGREDLRHHRATYDSARRFDQSFGDRHGRHDDPRYDQRHFEHRDRGGNLRDRLDWDHLRDHLDLEDVKRYYGWGGYGRRYDDDDFEDRFDDFEDHLEDRLEDRFERDDRRRIRERFEERRRRR